MQESDQNNSANPPSGLFNFFLHLGQAKRTYRAGWVIKGVHEPESIADHMYRMSMMAFFAPQHLDRNKCIEMCLVHDLAESVVGDLTPNDKVGKEEKAKLEKDAMKKLTDFVAESSPSTAERVQHLFEEYEAHACAEARFVKQVDLFDMYLQAYEYEQLNPHSDLAEFFSTADSYPFESPVKEWVAKLLHVRASPTTTSLLPADSNLNTILKFYLKQKKN